jgi:uncharacterized protein YndB with AHSA1/START domain
VAEYELARFIDRWTVEYLRTYPHPIERVWRAITDPKEFRAWFIHGEIELKEGGAYHFKSGDWTGVVQAVDPPRYIRFSNKTGEAAGWFEYELTPVADGTRMRFAQHFDPNGVYTPSPDLGGDLPGGPGTPWKPGFVGGWHEFWDSLGDYLDGVLTGSRLPKTEFAELVEDFMGGLVGDGRLTEDNARRLTLGLRRHERWNDLNKIYRAHIAATLPPA